MKQSKKQLEIKECLKTNLTLSPYASVSLFVLMHDPKGFNANSTHLEKALNHLDPREYARFKDSYQHFPEYVNPKIEEYQKNEESFASKDFAKRLLEKMNSLNQEIFKLKGGYVNSAEYENIFVKKLFDCAVGGNLDDF